MTSGLAVSFPGYFKFGDDACQISVRVKYSVQPFTQSEVESEQTELSLPAVDQAY